MLMLSFPLHLVSLSYLWFPQADHVAINSILQYDFSGRSKGEATMEFASYQQAKIAINQFDGAMTKGTLIRPNQG
jgi:THO complex subunit 4